MVVKKNIIEIVGAPSFKNNTIFKDGTNSDVIKTLLAAVQKATKQVAQIANKFKGKTELTTLKNIHSFIRKNLKYKKDLAGYQQIKLPKRYLLESGDCKSKALFIASLLNNLGFSHGFVFANYNILKGNTPSHVYNYAILKNGQKIYIDGTYKIFNKQPKPNYQKEMIIQTLSNDMSGLYGPKKKPLKTAFKKVLKGAKTVGIAPARGAFLAIVALNVRDYAKNLKNLQPARLTQLLTNWEKLGGKKELLLKAINKGASKKRILDDIEGIGEPITVTLASAAPVIAKLSTFLGQASKGGQVLQKVTTAAAKVKNLTAPAQKLITTAQKNKTLTKLKQITNVNPNLKAKLTALGKTKGQKVLNKIVKKVTPGIVTTTSAQPSNFMQPSNFVQRSEDTATTPDNLTDTTAKETTGNKINFKNLALIGGGGLLAYTLIKN